MTSIGIISACFGRTGIFEIFASGVQRLRQETGFDIPCVVAGDIGGADVCHEYGIEHIEFPNKPLTGKFNRACQELKDRVDYVMISGTDNLLSTKTFQMIQAEAEKGIDLIGLNDVYFYGMDGIQSGKFIYFGTTKVLGVGRTVSSRVLDQIDWKPWRVDRDRGIDTVMLDSVRDLVKTSVLLEGGFVVDLKTSWNLNRIDFWAERKDVKFVDPSLLFDNIGEEEIRLIREFIDKQK